MEKEKKKLNLKILILIAITVVVITIVGIVILLSNKSVKLTQDNYSSYLEISPKVSGQDQFSVQLDANLNTGMNYVSNEDEYSKIIMYVDSKGLSNNFIYEDVEIEVHFLGDIPLQEKKTNGSYNSRYAITHPTFGLTGESKHIDKVITIKLDVSGNIISGQESSYTEELGKGRYASNKVIQNSIKKDIKIKGKIKEK